MKDIKRNSDRHGWMNGTLNIHIKYGEYRMIITFFTINTRHSQQSIELFVHPKAHNLTELTWDRAIE